MQEKERELKENVADCGKNTPGSFVWYDRATSLWRTYQRCLGGEWALYSGTWPRAGTMRSGIAYPQVPLAPLTGGIGSGSWPTPQAQMPGAGPESSKVKNLLTGNRHSFYLTQAVEAERQKPGIITQMWPTPRVSDVTGGPRSLDEKGRRVSPSGLYGANLADKVKMWPTPMAHNAKEGGYPSEFTRNTPTLAAEVKIRKSWPTPSASDNRDRGNMLTPAIKRRIAKGKQAMLSMVVSEVSGQLNPTWVEWLMGFPLGWTDLKDSATPSSPKSSNGLDEE